MHFKTEHYSCRMTVGNSSLSAFPITRLVIHVAEPGRGEAEHEFSFTEENKTPAIKAALQAYIASFKSLKPELNEHNRAAIKKQMHEDLVIFLQALQVQHHPSVQALCHHSRYFAGLLGQVVVDEQDKKRQRVAAAAASSSAEVQRVLRSHSAAQKEQARDAIIKAEPTATMDPARVPLALLPKTASKTLYNTSLTPSNSQVASLTPHLSPELTPTQREDEMEEEQAVPASVVRNSSVHFKVEPTGSQSKGKTAEAATSKKAGSLKRKI